VKSHPDSTKLILIVPGATGCSDDRYIRDLVHIATQRGFCCAVMNHLVPKAESTDGLRLVDFSMAETMNDAIIHLKQHLPECSQVFAVGFSLGGNYVLRSFGHDKTPFNAVATVS
jgi:predicted alpha/beta-fold hydrolase